MTTSLLPNRSARCRVFLTVLLWPVFLAGASAEEPPKPLQTPKLTEVVRQGWLRAQIVSGRITFRGTRLGSKSDVAKSNGREERVSLRVTAQELAMRYDLSAPNEELLLEITGADEFHARRIPKGDGGPAPVDFRQSAGEPLRLTVGPAGEERVYSAQSLWHLLVAAPAICSQHLVPLLQVLDEQWDLTTTAEQVEVDLLQAAGEGNLPDPRRWGALVEQLGDQRYARREAADRELRTLGRIVLTYLEQLDQSRLDAEQRYRVRRILIALSASMENDTPPQIARWLAGDPVVWLAMLTRDDESTRRLAAERLEALLGKPVEFDPAADAPTRASQIEQLRARILDR
ncbi:MAG: hypothetical protein ABIP48_06505 [Planctomycetota bacterium]